MGCDRTQIITACLAKQAFYLFFMILRMEKLLCLCLSKKTNYAAYHKQCFRSSHSDGNHMNPSQAFSADRPAPDSTGHAPEKKRSRGLTAPLLALVVALGWLTARGGFFTPGDDFGYYLGLVGAIMMLVLLLYPLRKHVGFLRKFGAISHWFRLHMLFGIAGPLLILFHSTFTIGSLNAGVAMGCMVLVAGSGVVGRFMYRRIHHGLYGRRATLQEMQAQLGTQEGEVRSKFHFAPRIESHLKAFGDLAHTRPDGFLRSAWQFLTISLRARRVHAQCMRELRKVLGGHAVQRGWERAKLQHRLAAASEKIRSYLEAARHTAQFSIYERLFSLWHILHVPFVFMLVISGVVHVIAVHMY